MADEEMQIYQRFKEEFGEDGNIMVVGIEGAFDQPSLVFNAMYDLVEQPARTVEGVDEALAAITHLLNLGSRYRKSESFSLFAVG